MSGQATSVNYLIFLYLLEHRLIENSNKQIQNEHNAMHAIRPERIEITTMLVLHNLAYMNIFFLHPHELPTLSD